MARNKIKLYGKDGSETSVTHPVDARELIAQGFYSLDKPEQKAEVKPEPAKVAEVEEKPEAPKRGRGRAKQDAPEEK